jgi:hypothetical protein
VIQAWICGNAIKGVTGAGFGIGSTIDEEGQASLDDGSCAHGTGFQRYIEYAMVQPPGMESLSRLGDGEHLGMRSRVVK